MTDNKSTPPPDVADLVRRLRDEATYADALCLSKTCELLREAALALQSVSVGLLRALEEYRAAGAGRVKPGHVGTIDDIQRREARFFAATKQLLEVALPAPPAEGR